MTKVVQFSDRQRSAASSSGRTPDFGSRNAGSNPSAASNLEALMMARLTEAVDAAVPHFPLGTPKETIIKAMEKAKEGERFSMDVLIENNLDAEARARADKARMDKELEIRTASDEASGRSARPRRWRKPASASPQVRFLGPARRRAVKWSYDECEEHQRG